MFDNTDGFIRHYDGTNLVLFGLEIYNAIYDRIRYLVRLKGGITYVFPYNYGKKKIDSDDDLPLEETLTLYNVNLLIQF